MPRILLLIAFTFGLTFFSGTAQAATSCFNTQSVLAWDGTTDDTAALSTAIGSAISQAGNGAACVQLPVGTGVLCQVELPLAPNGLVIQGFGVGATTIRPCNSTTKIFSSSQRQTRNLDIGKFTISPTSTQTQEAYFDLRDIYNIYIHDVKATSGWNFANIQNSVIVHFCQTDLRNFGGIVFTIDGGADFRWCSANNYDDDTPEQQATAYLMVKSGGGFVLGGIDAIHCGQCYVFSPKPNASIEWIFASQTMADTCSGHGWTLNAPAGTVIKGFQGVGIWSASCAGSGFYTTGSGTIDGVSLIGPRIQNNAGDGGHFEAGTAIDISAPMITGNSQGQPGIYSGLSFSGTANNFTVNGGHVGTMMQYGDSQLRNIVIHPGNGKNFAVLGVNLCGFAPGGAAFLDASTNASKMVRNNLCFNSND